MAVGWYVTQRYEFTAKCGLTSRQQAIVLSGGLLNHTKSAHQSGECRSTPR